MFPGLWSASIGGADGVKGILGFCRTRVGCGPASGPTLKKVLCRTCPVVGRRINKVLILQREHLIYWKWCQHTTSKDMDCYWQVIDHMEVYSKIKQDFFQAVAVSILLYRCTIWTLAKCLEKKKLERNENA